MSPSHSHAQLYTQPTFVELFTPKLVTVFREGYGWRDLRADAVSGLTVAVVALPLSMAIAIASGVSPERGLYTAIFGGLIISLIGGSRFQIGGPAGAFIGLVAGVVERHGYDGLALATIIAGLILIAVGLLRAGTYIKYIPFPVTVGFTAGIAVIIAASQIRDLFGLTIAHEPSALLPKLLTIRNALPTVHFPTLGIAILSVVLIVALRRFRPNWPLIDTTAARSLVTFVNKVGRLGTSVVFAAARPTVRRTLNRAGLKPPLVRYSATAREAATMAPQ
jgi:sulfate permease, SulP family